MATAAAALAAQMASLSAQMADVLERLTTGSARARTRFAISHLPWIVD